jgi:CubicO group peptidase (beta-lactamase class C family)
LKAGYGWADRAHQWPFTTTTIAQIGSLTKQFTAAVVVDLAHRGKLNLDAPISTYVPDVPPGVRGVTLRALLTHSAGAPAACGGDFQHLSRDEVLGRCLRLIEPAKGGTYAYSNLGYSILAAVVERVSGRPIEAELLDRFFVPLGLADTRYEFPAANPARHALGYNGDQPVPPIHERLRPMRGEYWNLKGNGGMQSTVEEMYQWYRALMHGAPSLDPTLVRDLTAPGTPRDSTLSYGFGWNIRVGADGTVEQASHTGGDGTFFAAIVWRPKDRMFYYLVTNTGNDGGAESASRILRLLRQP